MCIREKNMLIPCGKYACVIDTYVKDTKWWCDIVLQKDMGSVCTKYCIHCVKNLTWMISLNKAKYVEYKIAKSGVTFSKQSDRSWWRIGNTEFDSDDGRCINCDVNVTGERVPCLYCSDHIGDPSGQVILKSYTVDHTAKFNDRQAAIAAI